MPVIQLPDLMPAAQSAAEERRMSRLVKVGTPSYQVATVTDAPSAADRSDEEISEPAVAGTSKPDLVERADSQDVSHRLPGTQSAPDLAAVPHGPAWGTLIHGLLDFAMRHPACQARDIERMARWLSRSDANLQLFLSTAVETVEQFRASDLWQHAQQSSERLTEVPVAILESAANQPPTILHGIVDLLLKSTSGWEIVDYKTDALDAETVRERYEGQVLRYKKVWELVTESKLGTTTTHPIRQE